MTARNILCVDDDQDTCASMSDVLTDLGYEVGVAFDGRTAVQLVEQRGYVLALLDYKLPDTNGVELFLRLRQVRPRLPGVVITAFASIDVVDGAVGAGVRRILPKPVNFGELLPLIEEIVGEAA